MKYDDLTEEMRSEIVDAVKNVLLKLGINVDVMLSARIIYDGREMIEIKTDSFNTKPVIYKEVTVHGEGFISNIKDNVFGLYLSLCYKFKYFSGGENGVDIGVSQFQFYTETGRVRYMGTKI